MIIIIVYDFEVLKFDWCVVWLDTETRKTYAIVNDVEKLFKFYEKYKNRIMVGYNSRSYDVWILKGILCGFDPYEITDWIINKHRKGFLFSRELNKFPLINYDCSVGFRSLKELEAFQGHDIQESNIPFDIDRKLTDWEMKDLLKYCKHDVMETFSVFIETQVDFESHMGLIKEYNLDLYYVNKTSTQLSAVILGASKITRDDEFEISTPDVLQLGKYDWVREWYMDWAKNERNYETMELKTEVGGIPHVFGIGGIHGAVKNYMGEGDYLMADVESYYPALLIEFGYLSRNVSHPEKFREIRDERLILKENNDPRQLPRKLVLNKASGGAKDKYNQLYDPLQSNNACVTGQLLLVDLIDKLEGRCELIQSNTDGILIKLFDKKDRDEIINLSNEWCDRTGMKLKFDSVSKVIQRDVNNYIIVFENGKIKRKGAVVKELSILDNDLPIVNRAVVNYLTNNIPVISTINASMRMIDFQKITKITSKYEYGFKEDARGKEQFTDSNGKLYIGSYRREKVHRCFASSDSNDGAFYKKKKTKGGLDKTASTPIQCKIVNSDITEMKIPQWLDRKWYCELAEKRIKEFLGD